MCGIIGYIGKKNAQPVILEALTHLEYRGYDSAGIAVLVNREISVSKCKGRISALKKLLKNKKIKANSGLGHTRWATHGEPSQKNAHPHLDCSKKIAVVHNGIIENYMSLKKELENKGCVFKSETDTEVIAHLISSFYKKDIKQAIIKTTKKLKGTYAIGVLTTDNPGKIYAVKHDSPLIIGVGKNENFIASDIPAILGYTNKVIYPENGQIVSVSGQNIEIFTLKNEKINYQINKISYKAEDAKKGGYKYYMLKEINEQPKILNTLILSHVKNKKVNFNNLTLPPDKLKSVKRILITACGTAYHAAISGKYIIESLTKIPVEVNLSSELRYSNPIITKNTLVIAISQSGETADTLAAVKKMKDNKVKVLSICNVQGSSLSRESDAIIYTCAGPEIGVASTKAYTAQLAILYLFAVYAAQIRKTMTTAEISRFLSEIKKIPEKQQTILNNSLNIKNIAKRHLHFGAFLYLGRHINYPLALEGALKLKEISYIPAEGYAAGEMKHGPIALIDEYRAVVCIANNSFVYDKMVSNMQEILARKGKVIAIATDGNKKINNYVKEIIYIPKTDNLLSCLLTSIPLQLIAYYIADLKGFDVDKPRNLAKSVTVE